MQRVKEQSSKRSAGRRGLDQQRRRCPLSVGDRAKLYQRLLRKVLCPALKSFVRSASWPFAIVRSFPSASLLPKNRAEHY